MVRPTHGRSRELEPRRYAWLTSAETDGFTRMLQWGPFDTAWDISHARRLVRFLETMYDYPEITDPSLDGDVVRRGFANQLVYNVFNGDWEEPKFVNFFNGINVSYTRPHISYPPFALSHNYLNSGFGFWWRYNPDVKRLNQAMLDFITRNPDYPRGAPESELMNFLASFSRPRQH